jgi:hypothetical protein
MISLQTQNSVNDKVDFHQAPKLRHYSTISDPNPVFGLGIKLDSDMSKKAYSIRIKSDLDGASNNSMFTFALCRNTLQYSKNGVLVST